jgi:hypothetical protein
MQVLQMGEVESMVSFGELMDAAAPPTAVPASTSDHAVRMLREASHKRGWRTGWLIGGSLGLALLSAGAAVAASTGLLSQLPWAPDFSASPGDGGQSCKIALRIDVPAGVDKDAPYLVEARQSLRELDVATLDTSEAYRDVKREYEVNGVYDNQGDRVRRSDEEYRAEALDVAVREELDRKLRASGFGDELDDTGYRIQEATLCGGDAR